jgi:O-methyltransferase
VKFDAELREIVERVEPQTMTTPPKLAALVEATRYVVRLGIPGAVVECGVWRGGSMQAVALTLHSLGDTDRELHLFDTFEGMPPPSPEDARTDEAGTVAAETLLATSDKDSDLWAVAGLDVVRATMADTPYPPERVHFHPGMVEDTTPGEAPETIALLRLDTDWYASTKHELDHLYERLSSGGVLILDDYGDWDGARKATDEWLAETSEPIFLAPMGSGRIGIKPFGTPS